MKRIFNVLRAVFLNTKKRVFDHFLWRKTSGVAGAICTYFFSILAVAPLFALLCRVLVFVLPWWSVHLWRPIASERRHIIRSSFTAPFNSVFCIYFRLLEIIPSVYILWVVESELNYAIDEFLIFTKQNSILIGAYFRHTNHALLQRL